MDRKKKAMIFGVTGQCGSYLADLLLDKGYEVYGVIRRTSTNNYWRIEEAKKSQDFHIVYADVTDFSSIYRVLDKVLPDEIYNMAAQSFVGVSFEEPLHTFDVTATGCLNILESIRLLQDEHWKPRFYQASSSEQFGTSYSTMLMDTWEYGKERQPDEHIFQYEDTPMEPQSPYAVAKLAAYNFTLLYRKYDIYAATGILFNNESPRRGDEFVTQKIAKYVAGLSLSTDQANYPKLKLGNLTAKRDWGYSLDYMEGVWRILQQPQPGEYVLATGETHTVLEFVKEAFSCIGIDDYMAYVEEDPQFKRPAEVPYLRGDASKAKLNLGWRPKVNFEELVRLMVNAQIYKKS